jgi:protein-disulfide isomerase
VLTLEDYKETTVRLVLLCLAVIVTGLSPAAAQNFTPAQRADIVAIVRDALRNDPSILRDAFVELQKDEAQGQERAAGAAIVRLDKQIHDPADAIEGNPLGDVTVVEFYDTRCPYCRRMLPVIADLVREEPNVRVAMKDMPILGPASVLESRALLAAQRQGGYFKMRDAVMANSTPSTADSLRDMANRLGLDGARMIRDMDDPAIKTRLEGNVALAQQIGIQGTPAMVIGTTLLAGAADIGELRQAIAAARQRR